MAGDVELGNLSSARLNPTVETEGRDRQTETKGAQGINCRPAV